MMEMLKRMVVGLIRLLPMRKFIIFESHPDFSDNSYALYREFLRRGINKRYRIYWRKTFRGEIKEELPENVDVFEGQPVTLREDIKRTYVLNCSRFIIDCNTFVHKRRKKQVRIHLGHGMPIKIDLDYSTKFGECDCYMVQSEFWKDIFTEKIGVQEECICCLGYPRTDVLVHPTDIPEWSREVERYEKVIIWLPTYRQHKKHPDRAMESRYPYGMPCVYGEGELKRLGKLLEEKRILLLFRPHPVQDLSLWDKVSFPNIQMADDGYLSRYNMTLYELLAHTDALITDYSSVYFDYLLTDKPIALTIEDEEEYFSQFTPAFPNYKTYIKGAYVEHFDDLERFIRELAAGEDPAAPERHMARDMFHKGNPGCAAAGITDMLIDTFHL